MTIQDIRREWSVPALKRCIENMCRRGLKASDENVVNFISKNLLEDLTEMERNATILFYGLKDGIRKSYEEVGEELGITADDAELYVCLSVRKMCHPVRVKMIYGERAEG